MASDSEFIVLLVAGMITTLAAIRFTIKLATRRGYSEFKTRVAIMTALQGSVALVFDVWLNLWSSWAPDAFALSLVLLIPLVLLSALAYVAIPDLLVRWWRSGDSSGDRG